MVDNIKACISNKLFSYENTINSIYSTRNVSYIFGLEGPEAAILVAGERDIFNRVTDILLFDPIARMANVLIKQSNQTSDPLEQKNIYQRKIMTVIALEIIDYTTTATSSSLSLLICNIICTYGLTALCLFFINHMTQSRDYNYAL